MSNKPTSNTPSSKAKASAAADNLPIVSHLMSARFQLPLRLLGWSLLFACLVEIVSVGYFNFKHKDPASEWSYFTMVVQWIWGYALVGFAFIFVVPAGPIGKWELRSLRLAHHATAVGFALCLILLPIGFTRWVNLKKLNFDGYMKDVTSAKTVYRQTEITLDDQTDYEKLINIARISGLYESVKNITNPGELKEELKRRLKTEKENRLNGMEQNWLNNNNNHKLALVRSMSALLITFVLLGFFWWNSRASRQKLSLPGERKNSSEEYFPYA